MKILYICTHNRCRSILSEALTNALSGGLIEARSAGSQPAGEVHPLTLQHLQEAGVPIAGLYSKSWDELETFAPDVVITVCDAAANESCPVWFGKAVKVHWGLADPSKVTGSEAEKANAFRDCIAEIRQRVEALLRLPEGRRDAASLKAALGELGAQA